MASWSQAESNVYLQHWDGGADRSQPKPGSLLSMHVLEIVSEER